MVYLIIHIGMGTEWLGYPAWVEDLLSILHYWHCLCRELERPSCNGQVVNMKHGIEDYGQKVFLWTYNCIFFMARLMF